MRQRGRPPGPAARVKKKEEKKKASMMEAGRFIPAKTNMAFSRKRKKKHMKRKGNLCSLFEKAFVTTDLTGGPCGIRNAVWGCAPDFSARKTSAW